MISGREFNTYKTFLYCGVYGPSDDKATEF
jgi:hypothetical protein